MSTLRWLKSLPCQVHSGDKAYTFDFFGWNPNLVSITWSHGLCKAKCSDSFFLKTNRYLWNLVGTISSTDFSIFTSSPMSWLSVPHMCRIDVYNFDQSFFSIMIGSTTFGISTSISSSIVAYCVLILFSSPTSLLLFLITFCLLSDMLHSHEHLVISTFPVSQSISGLQWLKKLSQCLHHFQYPLYSTSKCKNINKVWQYTWKLCFMAIIWYLGQRDWLLYKQDMIQTIHWLIGTVFWPTVYLCNQVCISNDKIRFSQITHLKHSAFLVSLVW